MGHDCVVNRRVRVGIMLALIAWPAASAPAQGRALTTIAEVSVPSALASDSPPVVAISESTPPKSLSGSGCGPFVAGSVTLRRSSAEAPTTVHLSISEVNGDAVEASTPQDVAFAVGDATASTALIPHQGITEILVELQQGDGYTLGEPKFVAVPVEGGRTFCRRTGDLPVATVEPVSGPPGTVVVVSGGSCPEPSWYASYNWKVHVQISPEGAAPSAGQITAPTGEPPSGGFGFTMEGYPGRMDADTTPASDGAWSVTLKIPDAGDDFPAVPGVYPISALCYPAEGANLGHVIYAQPLFEVTSAAGPNPSLPRTGIRRAVGESLVGIVLIALGMAIASTARKRQGRA